MSLPAPVDELVRVYEMYQKNLEKQREKTKTDDFKVKNRLHAKRFYERHKEEVIEKRRKYYQEHRDELKARYLEAYHRKKAQANQENTPAADA